MQIEVWDPMRAHERLDRFTGRGVIQAHPHETKSTLCITLVKLYKDRYLFAAGKTPGRPEVQQDGLTAHFRESDALAVEVAGGVLRSRGAETRRPMRVLFLIPLNPASCRREPRDARDGDNGCLDPARVGRVRPCDDQITAISDHPGEAACP